MKGGAPGCVSTRSRCGWGEWSQAISYHSPLTYPPLTTQHLGLKESTAMKDTIGFIGLGGMGLAMAGNLLKAGFRLRVFNRTVEKARSLVELGARVARSPAEVAEPGGV